MRLFAFSLLLIGSVFAQDTLPMATPVPGQTTEVPLPTLTAAVPAVSTVPAPLPQAPTPANVVAPVAAPSAAPAPSAPAPTPAPAPEVTAWWYRYAQAPEAKRLELIQEARRTFPPARTPVDLFGFRLTAEGGLVRSADSETVTYDPFPDIVEHLPITLVSPQDGWVLIEGKRFRVGDLLIFDLSGVQSKIEIRSITDSSILLRKVGSAEEKAHEFLKPKSLEAVPRPSAGWDTLPGVSQIEAR